MRELIEEYTDLQGQLKSLEEKVNNQIEREKENGKLVASINPNTPDMDELQYKRGQELWKREENKVDRIETRMKELKEIIADKLEEGNIKEYEDIDKIERIMKDVENNTEDKDSAIDYFIRQYQKNNGLAVYYLGVQAL